MEGAKETTRVGLDVGKASFSAALYQDTKSGRAEITSLPKIPVLHEFQQRLISKGKKKMTARCACMRKMLLLLRSMVVHNMPFDENYFKNSTRWLDFRHTIYIFNSRKTKKGEILFFYDSPLLTFEKNRL